MHTIQDKKDSRASYVHVEVHTNKTIPKLQSLWPLIGEGQDIQLIRKVKVDSPRAGPITAGAPVNSVNKVTAGVGGHLGGSEAAEKGWMRGNRDKD